MFPEEVRVAAVMTNVTVKHIIGHEGEAGPAESEREMYQVNHPALLLMFLRVTDRGVNVRRVDAKRVGSEPLHTQSALKFHLPQLPPALLIPRSSQSLSGF